MQTNQHPPSLAGLRARTLAGITVVALLAVLSVPLALWAHAHLRRSEPAARERVTSAPAAIRLWFSERPQLAFTRIRLRGADSTDIVLGPVAAMAGEPFGVSAPVVGALSSGTYRVAWRTGGADGHVVAGSFEFVFAAERIASAARVADTSARLPSAGHALIRIDPGAERPMRVNAYAATRWVEFSAMLAVLGAIVFRLVVLHALERRAVGHGPGRDPGRPARLVQSRVGGVGRRAALRARSRPRRRGRRGRDRAGRNAGRWRGACLAAAGRGAALSGQIG